MVFRKYKEVLHRKIIDSMMVYFRKLRIKLHTNSKIIIWHQWRLYLRRKAKKAEKKRKAAEAKAKKKGKYGGGARKSMIVSNPSGLMNSPDKKTTSMVAKPVTTPVKPTSNQVSTENLASTTALP